MGASTIGAEVSNWADLTTVPRSAYHSVRTAPAPLATQQTTDRRAPIPKNVPLLRIDHISIQGKVFGVWRSKRLRAVKWTDCK